MVFILVIEGMDNTGKSTLALKFKNEFNFEIKHSPGKSFSWGWVKKEINRCELIIYDRFPLISEQVYGPVLRGENRIFSNLGDYWLSQFQQKEPLIIYCRPPAGVISDFSGNEEQMKGVERHLLNLIKQYDKVISRLKYEGGWKIIKFDYTQNHGKSIMGEVRKWLKN